MGKKTDTFLTSLGIAGALAGQQPARAETSDSAPPPQATPIVQKAEHPDPFNKRFDMSGQAEALLFRDSTGRPSLFNWWPEGTPPEKRILRVSMANVWPKEDIMPKPGNQLENYKKNFVAPSKDTETALKRCAEDFKTLYGITLEVGRNLKNPDIVIGGYNLPNDMFKGIATPPPTNRVDMGKPRCGILLNEGDFATFNAASIYLITYHELQHSVLGMMHTFDPRIGSDSASYARYNTAISYNYPEFTPQGAGLPPAGAIDADLRRVLGLAPLTRDHGNVQLSRLNEEAGKRNPKTGLYLPGQWVVGGKGSKLNGTEHSDLIDLNPRMVGEIAHDQFTANAGHQHVTITEGGFDRVRTAGGNDIVILRAGQGKQYISPGSGTNEVHMYYPNTGAITIDSEGKDTLVILDKALNGSTPSIQKNCKNVTLSLTPEASFTFDGKGLNTLKVVNDKGETRYEANTAELNAEGWNTRILPKLTELSKTKWQHFSASPSKDKSDSPAR